MIERPTARYGRQRLTRRQRRLIAGGLTALVLVAGVTIAVVASGRFGGAVKGELGGYRLVDDETVDVTINVTREDPAQPVVCIVRARSIDGSETGRREVLVPPCHPENGAGDDRGQVQQTAGGRRCVRLRHRRTYLPRGPLKRTARQIQQTPNCEYVKIRCPRGATMDRYTVPRWDRVLLHLVR